MAKYRGLQIERDGDTLTIRAKNSIRWLGALFVGAGLGFMFAAANPHADQISHTWISLLCGMYSVGCGVFLLVPQAYTTMFDSRSPRLSIARVSVVAHLKWNATVSRRSRA
ncbi:MAG: hypothetical protein USCAAHI_01669 [Beijerinckiaceae bacterium]|nr:MAG: hypothetical protein USCAAHI_01669 [Beijerinckiaceae bacterium]